MHVPKQVTMPRQVATLPNTHEVEVGELDGCHDVLVVICGDVQR